MECVHSSVSFCTKNSLFLIMKKKPARPARPTSNNTQKGKKEESKSSSKKTAELKEKKTTESSSKKISEEIPKNDDNKSKVTKSKPKTFEITPFISSFNDILKPPKMKLDLSNTKISSWDGFDKFSEIQSLYVDNTFIYTLKGTKIMENLRKISLKNTPLSFCPFFEESIIYAFGFSVHKINGHHYPEDKLNELRSHPLAKNIQEMIRKGYLLSQFPNESITDINALVYDPENGFKSPITNIPQQHKKRDFEECCNILSKFSAIKYSQPAIINQNYRTILKYQNSTENE